MLNNVLTKLAARVVIIGYLTQTVAPVVWACEVENRPPENQLSGFYKDTKPSSKPLNRVETLASPTPQAQTNANTFLQPPAVPQSSYAYRLKVKTQGRAPEDFVLKLSRRLKDSTGSFEKLYRAQSTGGQFSSTVSDQHADVFLTLLQGTTVYKSLEIGKFASYVWNLNDLGSFSLDKDGRFTITQEGDVPFLSSLDLIVKTTQTLLIDSLKAHHLTVNAPETHLLGDVRVDHLHMDRTVINEGIDFNGYGVIKEGGLRMQKITGQGTFQNQGTLILEGTVQAPAVLGVAKVVLENEKVPEVSQFRASHLHITPDNQSVVVGKGATFSVKDSLKADAPTHKGSEPSFLNKGVAKLGEALLHREARNLGSWKAREMRVEDFTITDEGDLTILEQLLVGSQLVNEGSLDVKKLLRVASGVNRGASKTGELCVEKQMTNEGEISLQKLSGGGTLQNHRELNFLREVSEVSINRVVNETKSIKKPALISGKRMSLQEGQKSFVNGENAVIKVGQVQSKESTIQNSGIFETPVLEIEKGKFHNKSSGTLTVDQKTHVKDGTFQNDGKLTTNGSFTKDKDVLTNGGTWNHIGNLDTGEAQITNTGTMNWMNGLWKSTSITVQNHGIWQLEDITSYIPISVRNEHFLHLKRGTISFRDLINNDTIEFSQGLYMVVGSFENNHRLKFLQNEWVITDDPTSAKQFLEHLKSTYAIQAKEKQKKEKGPKPTDFKSAIDAYLDDPLELLSLLLEENIILRSFLLPDIHIPVINPVIPPFPSREAFVNSQDYTYAVIDTYFDEINGRLSAISKENERIRAILTTKKSDTARPMPTHSKFEKRTKQFVRLNRNQSCLILPQDKSKVQMKKKDNSLQSLRERRRAMAGKEMEFNPKDAGIESQKTLTYDVLEFSGEIRSQGDVTFTQRYQHLRKLDDLLRIKAPKNQLTFYLLSLNTPRNYELSNIGHLALYVTGSFNTSHEFKAPILTLDVEGPLHCGQSNEKMGTIAATRGPLTAKARLVDARFGKLFGDGLTTIRSTKGDILVGAAATAVDEDIKKKYLEYGNQNPLHYCQSSSLMDYSVSVQNGAYIASSDQLFLDSANDINVNCGKVFGGKGDCLKAHNNILNEAGRISSLGKTRLEAKNYKHTRAPAIAKAVQYCHSWVDYPGSGPAILESLDQIEIVVKENVTNVASHILSQSGVFINNRSLVKQTAGTTKNPSGYEDSSLDFYQRFCCLGGGGPHILTLSPTIQSGELIQVSMGGLRITSSMNAPGLVLLQSQTEVHIKGPKGRSIVVPAHTALLNVTENVLQSVARDNGLLSFTQDGGVRSEFSLGPLHSFPEIMPTMGSQRPAHSGLIFNPVASIPSGILNLYLQSMLSEAMGKVYFKGNRKKPLMAYLEDNAVQYCRDAGGDVVSLEQAQALQNPMILCKYEPVGDRFQQVFYAALPPSEFNTVEGLSGGECVIDAGGTVTLENAVLEFENDISIRSEDKLRLLTILKRILIPNGYQDVIDGETKVTSKKGSVTAVGKKGFEMKGVALRSMLGLIAGSTEGNTIIEDVLLRRLETFTSREDGGFFGKDKVTHAQVATTTGSHASKLQSEQNNVTVLSAEKAKTSITGSHLKALLAIIFKGSEIETNASVGMNSTSTQSEQKGMFSTSRTASMQQSANFYPTILEAMEIHTDTKKKATYRGTDFIADVLYDNTEEGASLGATITTLEYFQQMVAKSPLAKSDVGYKGGYEVMQPCRLAVNKIIRDINKGEIKFESVDWDRNRTEIIGKLAETTYQLKQWQTSWAHQEQVIPDEALVVVALAITIATQGTGAALFNSAVMSATGGTMVASSLGATLASAAFTSVCTQFGTAVLRDGDPLQAAQSLISEQGLRSIASNMAKAALIGTGGYKATAGFGTNLAFNMARASVGTAVDATVGGQHVNGKNFLNAAVQAGIETGAGYAASQLSGLSKVTTEDQLLHKGGHAVKAAVAKMTSNLVTGEKVGTNVLASSFGAVVGQMIAEGLTDEKALKEAIRKEAAAEGKTLTPHEEQMRYESAVQKISDISKLCAGTISLAVGLDVSSTITAATTALESDYRPRTIDALMSERLEQNLVEKGYSEEEARVLTHQIDEIAQELAEVDHEMAQAEEKAVQKIKVRQKSKQVANSHSEISSEEFDFLTKTTLREPSNEYQDIMLELAQEKQKIADKHQENLASRSWHEGLRDTVKEAGIILKEASIYAVNQALNDFSYIPNPIGTAAVAATEARDVYTGKKTLGEAGFDLAVGAAVGKGAQLTGKAVFQSAKTIAKPLIEKGKGALTTFTDYLSTKMSKGANSNVSQKVLDANYSFESSFWTRAKVHTFRGQANRVYKRDDLIDINKLDPRTGLTNLQRMQQGMAPIGPDFKPINLHHTIQTDAGSLAEVTRTFHEQYTKVIHINPNSIPSGIDRQFFDKWREAYWIERAVELGRGK